MMNTKAFKTGKGTELPLLNLRGRDYLEVKYRLVWFREEHPTWSIETEFVSITDKSACARAVVRDEQGRIIATSHKFENERGFPDFIEKAETGAIGRALALIGYGTQFCADELDEGDRIVDAPVVSPRVTSAVSESVDQSVGSGDSPGLRVGESIGSAGAGKPRVNPGDFLVPFGRKYRGKKISEIPQKEIESYVVWIEADAQKKRTPLSYEAKLLKKAVELYYGGGAEAGDSESEVASEETSEQQHTG
jgi:hypothetical protein